MYSAACWASSGYNVAGCAALENSLRACMDAPVRGFLESTLDGDANNTCGLEAKESTKEFY